MPDISKAVEFLIVIANDDTHGYDQVHRYGPDYDCSSLTAKALNVAGFPVSLKSWSGNIEAQLRKCGFVDCEYPWKSGDVHISSGHHVTMSINQDEIVNASLNEKGKIKGGKTGDQTGKEICIRPYYEHKYGWTCHLRYNSELKPNEEIAIEVIKGKWGNGSTRKKLLTTAGYDYKLIQTLVNNILRK